MAELVSYEIRFRQVEGSGTIESKARAQDITDKPKTTEDIVEKKPNIKVLGTIGALWGATQTVSRPLLTHHTNNALLNGDFVQAKTTQIQAQKVNKLVNLGFSLATLGATALVNPVAAGIGAAALMVGQVTQVVNMVEQNRVIRAQNDINNFISSVDANRLIGGMR